MVCSLSPPVQIVTGSLTTVVAPFGGNGMSTEMLAFEVSVPCAVTRSETPKIVGFACAVIEYGRRNVTVAVLPLYFTLALTEPLLSAPTALEKNSAVADIGVLAGTLLEIAIVATISMVPVEVMPLAGIPSVVTPRNATIAKPESADRLMTPPLESLR
jgi:hypothetical protein